MINEIKVRVYQGVSTELGNYVFKGDITNSKIIFAVKLNKGNDYLRLISKMNDVAGGSSEQISAVYDSENDETTVKVKIDPNNTYALQADSYYYDIISEDNNGKRSLVAFGEFILIAAVQFPTDNLQQLPEIYVNQIYDKALTLIVNENATIKKIVDIGYNSNLTVSYIGDGVYKIENDADIFSGYIDAQARIYKNSSRMRAFVTNVVFVSPKILEVQLYDLYSRFYDKSAFVLEIKGFKNEN